ncbi:MAG: GNAT family N-acetyltransferase [Erythrobacter sp.]|jgi:GNAT superfamily N-acetyltransferase|nr:GNAT family N-acetyltransferase [Erythrobacter sp.]
MHHAAFERDRALISIPELRALVGAEEPPATILVAASGNELLGYAALTFDFSLWRARRWAHLDCLFVHERHRGKAIGSALLARARRVGRKAGADRLEGHTPQWNGRGIAFYKRERAMIASKARFQFDLAARADP